MIMIESWLVPKADFILKQAFSSWDLNAQFFYICLIHTCSFSFKGHWYTQKIMHRPILSCFFILNLAKNDNVCCGLHCSARGRRLIPLLSKHATVTTLVLRRLLELLSPGAPRAAAKAWADVTAERAPQFSIFIAHPALVIKYYYYCLNTARLTHEEIGTSMFLEM